MRHVIPVYTPVPDKVTALNSYFHIQLYVSNVGMGERMCALEYTPAKFKKYMCAMCTHTLKILVPVQLCVQLYTLHTF